MDLADFKRKLRSHVPSDMVLSNPGGGITTILAFGDDYFTYKRGKSKIRVTLRDLYEAYSAFRGKRVTSSDLKQWRPKVFDSTALHFGHSCNCTHLFTLLNTMGMVDDIDGRGVRGDPFFVRIP